MNPEAMKPFGLSLLDYYRGNRTATMTIIRDDGLAVQLPASGFFRDAQELKIEHFALDMAYGRILDAGAGAGIHSVFLQKKGFPVCSIDVSPEAVLLMRDQGVIDVRQADIMEFSGEKFDTIIMLGHGIGAVENMSGLSYFLRQAKNLLTPDGQILLTSVDVRFSRDPRDLEYQKQNIESGRYFGEVRMQFKYGDLTGPVCGWLQLDAQTLKERANESGLDCEVIIQQDDGNYLAKLSFSNLFE